MTFKVPEKYRITAAGGLLSSDASFGNNGAFAVPASETARKPAPLFCIASDGMGWERVSVSVGSHRLPTHDEMEYIKRLFWGDDSYVFEIHPPASEYVNNAPALHLWRPIGVEMPVPPRILVGLK